MDIKTKVGDFDVVECGSIVLNQSNLITFSIEDLEFEFVFQSEEGTEQKPYINLVTINSKKIRFQMVNYNNPLGTGIPNPLNVASLSTGEEVYLQYAIHGINELKIFHYTWYLKPISKVNAIGEDGVELKSEQQ